MITHIELNQIIEQGENSGVEFKSSDVRAESLAKEIVAFANSKGGVILIGVEDNKQVSGLSLDKKWEEWVANIARCNLNPAIEIEYQELSLMNKKVGIVFVPKGKDKPYQTNDGKFYIRVGSTNRMASINELMRLFQQSGVFHFDATAAEETSMSSLNFSKLSKYFESYQINFELLSEEEKISILKNSDILSENGSTTIAGLLVFGINPQKYLKMASVSFAVFAGTEISSELINKQNIEGNLDYQIDTTTALIKSHIPVASDIIGNKRTNKKDSYPDKVFRELIVNACCHRNYSIYGSKVRVFLFSDRLEVSSPGRLPNTITIEKLIAGVSYAVNPVIVKFMENMNYMDKLGRGLPMVFAESKKMGKSALFQEIGEEFKVTLYFE
ncbi:MAG: putative DNA binding domain-containing protein [Leptospiraceae bacterium]|nr:putative DNA binding domain-containing protein [Leptospiraceae bacterium]